MAARLKLEDVGLLSDKREIELLPDAAAFTAAGNVIKKQ